MHSVTLSNSRAALTVVGSFSNILSVFHLLLFDDLDNRLNYRQTKSNGQHFEQHNFSIASFSLTFPTQNETGPLLQTAIQSHQKPPPAEQL